jgi:signal transduction histidine kinase
MLKDFLGANRAALAARLRSERNPQRDNVDQDEGAIVIFLNQLIEALGRPPGHSDDAIGEVAAKHGSDLLNRGFTLAEVVHEYGDVGRAVAELASEASAPVTADEFRTLHRCLDQAISRAVTEYSRLRDRASADEARLRSWELAHELRNSLTSAMISFDVLRTGSVGSNAATAGVLSRSLQRLSTLIGSSLAAARLDAGVHASERVSMVELVEEVGAGAALEASIRKVRLAVSAVDPRIAVTVDRQLLAAAIGNLLQNAFKFGRPSGLVSLRTSATASRVLIEVEDECGGLPPDAGTTLFRPLVQRGGDRTGLGLGLSLTRKSVEASGGEVRLQDLPGVGCVFIIDLPRLTA